MADKMLRIAGRGTDGTAKAIRTDNEGSISAQTFILGKNLFNKDTVSSDKYINSTGNEISGTGWYATDYIPIDPRHKTITFNLLSGSENAGTAFYDGQKQIISFTSNTDIINNGYKIAIPPNAKFFRSSNINGNYGMLSTDEWQIEYGERSTRKGHHGVIPTNELDTTNRLPNDSFFDGYNLLSDREKYQLFELSSTGVMQLKIKCAYQHIIVRGNYNFLYLKDTKNNKHYKLTFSDFPGITSNDSFESVFIIPWSRNLETNYTQSGQNWRMVVVFASGRIYHNFPSRAVGSDGTEVEGDIVRFDESVIWDLTGRKFPSKDPTATGTETYFPGLPDSVYEYYPKPNTDPSFVDTYGNGGFGKSITINGNTYARFYEPRRGELAKHSFARMGGFSATDKITLLGTYRNNDGTDGTRICLFATHDGGRNWFCIYEFAGLHDNYLIRTRYINTSDLSSAYTADSFVIQKRTLIYPTASEKEPAIPFGLGDEIVVSNITRANPAVVTTKTEHGLVTGNVVVFKDNGSSEGTSPDWDWMLNPTASTSSGGNGKMFYVEVINSTSFKLCEYIYSPENNLPCRHIHCINRVKDGWMLGTGEVYPNGWVFYIQLKTSELYDVVRAYDFNYKYKLYRLNSTADSIQRPLGVMMLDDDDSSIVIGVDHGFIKRANVQLPEGRTIQFSRSSFGVYKGKMVDVDDFTQFKCLYEAEQPAYHFQDYNGVWVFIGQRGEVALSFDKGQTWYKEQLPKRKSAQHYLGMYQNTILIDDIAIVIK